jgi:pimeloyl-ACP methyl ester carboxylesterase
MSATDGAAGDTTAIRELEIGFDESELTGLRDNELDRGGHFAAWEQPQLFSQELRAAFRSLGT